MPFTEDERMFLAEAVMAQIKEKDYDENEHKSEVEFVADFIATIDERARARAKQIFDNMERTFLICVVREFIESVMDETGSYIDVLSTITNLQDDQEECHEAFKKLVDDYKRAKSFDIDREIGGYVCKLATWSHLMVLFKLGHFTSTEPINICSIALLLLTPKQKAYTRDGAQKSS